VLLEFLEGSIPQGSSPHPVAGLVRTEHCRADPSYFLSGGLDFFMLSFLFIHEIAFRVLELINSPLAKSKAIQTSEYRRHWDV